MCLGLNYPSLILEINSINMHFTNTLVILHTGYLYVINITKAFAHHKSCTANKIRSCTTQVMLTCRVILRRAGLGAKLP